jgi:hypothetical protein
MDNFESYKNEVIKELINYYGEEYRDLIISRVEDTDFIFYINPNFNDFLRYSEKKKDNYKELKKVYYKLQREIKKDHTGDGQIYSNKSRKSILYRSTTSENTIGFIYRYDNGENELKREIFLPLFYADDRAIIHEMIHSIMSSPLFLSENKNCKILEYKFGLCVLNDKGSDLLEECITEIEAREIRERLKSRNISFVDQYYLFEGYGCSYDYFIPYINSFYNLFKSDINDARITLNLRRLMCKVGKEDYSIFVLLLKDFYDTLDDCDKSFYKLYMEKYIDKMQKHSENNPLSLSRN